MEGFGGYFGPDDSSAVPGTRMRDAVERPNTAPGFEEGCLDNEYGRARSMVISLKRIADALSAKA